MNKITALLVAMLACAFAQAQLHIGDSLYALGNYNQSILAYRQTENTAVKIAKAYDALGNQTSAIQYYEKALAGENNDLLTRFEYGKLLLKADNYKKAESVFQRLQKEHPKNAEFTYQWGLTKEALGDSTALVTYLFVTILDEQHLNAHYKVAKHFTTKRNFLTAKTHVDKGLAIDDGSVRFTNLDALIHFYSKNFHGAVKQYEKLLTLNQSNEQLHHNLAMSYANTNQFEKAIEQYTVLINKFDDKNPGYHYGLARMYQSTKQVDKAIAQIEIGVLLQDISLDAQYLTLAGLYKKKGDYTQVFEMVKRAVNEKPNDSFLRYQYAVAADNYFKDKQTIINYYQYYLDKFPDGDYTQLAKQRIVDLKTDAHFSLD